MDNIKGHYVEVLDEINLKFNKKFEKKLTQNLIKMMNLC
jgi:hypothetical protein